jgi:tight adherence protein C
LSGELHQVQIEMPASRSRAEVFRALSDRNTEPELKRLAQVFLDSDRFGTGLAPALRTHVKFLRIRLRQQAYEQARKVSVKLVFPVFFLIFPSVILVTLGPALIQVYSQLNVLLK